MLTAEIQMSEVCPEADAISIAGSMVRLNGEVQDDGYLFVRSPDLPGFNIMLDPEDAMSDGAGAFPMSAIKDTLADYANAYLSALRKANLRSGE